MSALRPAWTRRLHVRAALLAVLVFALVAGAMVPLLRQFDRKASLEAAQRLNLGLAAYVVQQQAAGLLDADGRPDPLRVKTIAEHVMAINPSVDVYVLDADGRVAAHALPVEPTADPIGVAVDLVPVRRVFRAVLDGTELMLPVLGTDPLAPGTGRIFSAAPIGGTAQPFGYVYIVLDGRQARGLADSAAGSEARGALVAGVLLALALGATSLALAWRHLTRPLRELTVRVREFRAADVSTMPPVDGDELAELRHAIDSMHERISDQFQRLELADRQRRELTSNISHDLRTPLANIQGYIETVLLRGDSIDADQRAGHLRTALRHVERLGQRVADLFELSKLDAGLALPREEVFCLAELLQDVIQDYRIGAERAGITLRLAAGSQATARVRADIAMIERVLQNLVDNALRHTAHGGEIEMGIEACGAYLQVSVSDNGRGIDSRHLPHIFERYFRSVDAEADDSSTPASSGLGLTIVKRILDLHGSTIRVESAPKRGTRFEFLLPQVV